MNTNTTSETATSYLTRPEGRIAYDIDGSGSLVVLVPGMGDLRSTYRFQAPPLRQAGYRVACMDLRGHGESDVTFSAYGDLETSGDIVALLEELREPAVIVGNSMAAGSAVIAAATRPELVRGLVLVGPFVRNGKIGAIQRLLFRVAMAPPWAAWSGSRTSPSCTRGASLTTSSSTAARWWRISGGPGMRRRSRGRRTRTTTRRRRSWRGHGSGHGRDGRAGPGLPGPDGRSGVDRRCAARRGRHGSGRRALPPVAAAGRDDRAPCVASSPRSTQRA